MFSRKRDGDTPEDAEPAGLTHPPVRACPVCSSTSLTQTADAALHIYRDLGVGFQATGYLRASMVICDRCGRVELFAVDPSSIQAKLPSEAQPTAH